MDSWKNFKEFSKVTSFIEYNQDCKIRDLKGSRFYELLEKIEDLLGSEDFKPHLGSGSDWKTKTQAKLKRDYNKAKKLFFECLGEQIPKDIRAKIWEAGTKVGFIKSE